MISTASAGGGGGGAKCPSDGQTSGLNAAVRSRQPATNEQKRKQPTRDSSLMGRILMGIGMDPSYYLDDYYDDYDDYDHGYGYYDYNFNSATPRLSSIDSLSPYSFSWTIRARVIRKNQIRTYDNANGSGRLFDFEVQDESGQISLVAFNEDCDRLFNLVEKGKPYYISGGSVNHANKKFSSNKFQITLGYRSTIRPCNQVVQNIPKMPPFHFVPLKELISIENGTLVDVIGVIRTVNNLNQIRARETGKQLFKKDVEIADNSMFEVKFTIWGDMATEFNGKPDQIVALKNVSVLEFMKEKKLNCYSSTLVEVDPTITQATALRQWYQTQGKYGRFRGLKRDDSANAASTATATATCPDLSLICQLGSNSEKTHHTVIARVMHIASIENHFYKACSYCSKKVVLSDNPNNAGQYFCSKCDHLSADFKLRFKLSIVLADVTGSEWATVFAGQDQTKSLFNKTEEELAWLYQNDTIQYQRVVVQSMLLRRFQLRLKSVNQAHTNQKRMFPTVIDAEAVDDEPRKRAKTLFKMIDSLSGISATN